MDEDEPQPPPSTTDVGSEESKQQPNRSARAKSRCVAVYIVLLYNLYTVLYKTIISHLRLTTS